MKPLNLNLSKVMRQRRKNDHGSQASNELLNLAESEGSWAVAYADLLLVLMSFFVIFSSFGTDSTQDYLYKIAVQLSHVGKNLTDAAGTGNESAESISGGVSAGAGTLPNEEEKALQLTIPDSVFTKLSEQHLHFVSEGKSILIKFDGDQFSPGSFRIDSELGNQLTNIAKVLEPYKEHVQILITGHADSQAVKNHRNSYLQDNFDISSLRSLAGTRFLVSQGFPVNHLLSQAAADNDLSKRTLSLRISNFQEHPK